MDAQVVGEPATISTPSDPAEGVLDRLRRRLSTGGDREIYEVFLGKLHAYSQGRLSATAVVRGIQSLFANSGNAPLLSELINCLPPEVTAKLAVPDIDTAVNLVAKIREEQPQQLEEFCLQLRKFQSRDISIQDWCDRLVRSFANAPKICEEFAAFVPAVSALKAQCLAAPTVGKLRSSAIEFKNDVPRPSAQLRVVTKGAEASAIPAEDPNKTVKTFLGHASPAEAATMEQELRLFERIYFEFANHGLFKDFLKCLFLYSQGIASVAEFLLLVEDIFPMEAGDLPAQLKRLVMSREEKRRRYSFFTSPLCELDYSECERSGRSYSTLPRGFRRLWCSGRDALSAVTINDTFVSIPEGSEDFSSRVKKNHVDDQLHKCEEERFELDMLIDGSAAAARALEPLAEEINQLPPEQRESYKLKEAPFKVIHLRTISRIYGDHAPELLQLFRKSPGLAVPVVMKRLRQKRQEWIHARTMMEQGVWLETTARTYYRAFDLKAAHFKAQDRILLSTSAVMSDAIAQFCRVRQMKLPADFPKQNKVLTCSQGGGIEETCPIPVGLSLPSPPQFWSPEIPPEHSYYMPDTEVHWDVVMILLGACHQRLVAAPGSGSSNSMDRIVVVLRHFVFASFLGLSVPKLPTPSPHDAAPITVIATSTEQDVTTTGQELTSSCTSVNASSVLSSSEDLHDPLKSANPPSDDEGVEPTLHASLAALACPPLLPHTSSIDSEHTPSLRHLFPLAPRLRNGEVGEVLPDIRNRLKEFVTEESWKGAWDCFVDVIADANGPREMKQWVGDWKVGSRFIWDLDLRPPLERLAHLSEISEGEHSNSRPVDETRKPTTFYGSEVLYHVFRVYAVIYHRLSRAKQLCAERRVPHSERLTQHNVPWRADDEDPAARPTYRQFVDRILLPFIFQRISPDRFEEDCRFALANEASLFCTIQSLLNSMSKVLPSAVINDALFSRLAALHFAYAEPFHPSREDTEDMRDLRTRENETIARAIVGFEAPLFRFDHEPNFHRLSVRVLLPWERSLRGGGDFCPKRLAPRTFPSDPTVARFSHESLGSQFAVGGAGAEEPTLSVGLHFSAETPTAAVLTKLAIGPHLDRVASDNGELLPSSSSVPPSAVFGPQHPLLPAECMHPQIGGRSAPPFVLRPSGVEDPRTRAVLDAAEHLHHHGTMMVAVPGGVEMQRESSDGVAATESTMTNFSVESSTSLAQLSTESSMTNLDAPDGSVAECRLLSPEGVPLREKGTRGRGRGGRRGRGGSTQISNLPPRPRRERKPSRRVAEAMTSS